MKDYGKIYREVRHFGIWADDSADANGAADALAILADAVERSRDQDLNHDQATADALDYLSEQAGAEKPVALFRKGMAIPHPVTRRHALADAYKRLCRTAQGHRTGDL